MRSLQARGLSWTQARSSARGRRSLARCWHSLARCWRSSAAGGGAGSPGAREWGRRRRRRRRQGRCRRSRCRRREVSLHCRISHLRFKIPPNFGILVWVPCVMCSFLAGRRRGSRGLINFETAALKGPHTNMYPTCVCDVRQALPATSCGLPPAWPPLQELSPREQGNLPVEQMPLCKKVHRALDAPAGVKRFL